MVFGSRAGLLACAAVLGLAAMPLAASASPMTGTYDIKIYQGTGNGSSTNAIEQANLANPLFSSSLVADVTYTGALDFAASANTLASFLASGGGVYSGLGAAAGNMLSTGSFAFTSLFSITGISGGSTSGIVTHDDGASLYQFGHTVFDASAPTVASDSAYKLANGAFNLVYVEANGMPSVLDMDTVPEPASIAVLAIGLFGLYSLRRQSRA